MSLTGWLTDYIYIPLGGNRKGQLRKDLNILAVFLVSGLWHGADYTFVVWGLLHGIFRVGEEILRGIRKPKERNTEQFWKKCLKILGVFCLAAFAFLFFRATSIGEAFEVLGYLRRPAGLGTTAGQLSLLAYTAYGGNIAATKLGIGVLAMSLILAFLLDLRQKTLDSGHPARIIPVLSLPFAPALFLMAVMYLALILTGVFGVSNFIYFQF